MSGTGKQSKRKRSKVAKSPSKSQQKEISDDTTIGSGDTPKPESTPEEPGNTDSFSLSNSSKELEKNEEPVPQTQDFVEDLHDPVEPEPKKLKNTTPPPKESKEEEPDGAAPFTPSVPSTTTMPLDEYAKFRIARFKLKARDFAALQDKENAKLFQWFFDDDEGPSVVETFGKIKAYLEDPKNKDVSEDKRKMDVFGHLGFTGLDTGLTVNQKKYIRVHIDLFMKLYKEMGLK